MLDNIIHSSIGLFHTITAALALVFGTIVLLKTKGNKTHKRIGYMYVTMMLLLNTTSFFIVSFGGFSIFHFFAIVSLVSIFGGMIPTIMRVKSWFHFHFYFMSWSVVGLYCAFWAELFTRFVGNMQQFWWVVALSATITSIIGAIVINKNAKELNLR